MEHKPSKYQQAIYDAWKNTYKNIAVGAGSGSGKTSTAIGMIKRSPASITKLYLAFNKSIQLEITNKVQDIQNVQCLTLHSLGMRSIFDHFKDLKVEKNKSWILARKLNKTLWKLESKEFKATMMRVSNMVDLWRMTMCNNIHDMMATANSMAIDYVMEDIIYTEDLIKAYARYNKAPKMIDFTDMIYIPLVNPKIKIKTKAKMLWIDESQDLNLMQHAFVDKITKTNKARWCSLGDKRQAIYGFAGASSDSFELFNKKPNTISLPLSICYRCSDTIVDEANTVFDVLEKNTHKGEGRIEREGRVSEIKEGDMVVCRNTKPLVDLFFRLLNRDMPAKIKGAEMGKGLINLLEPMKHMKSHLMLLELDKVELEKLKKLQEMEVSSPKNHPMFQKFTEQKQICTLVAEKYQRTDQIISLFKRIFTDGDFNGVTLSTIHKSKGLENERVFFLNSSLIPSKYADTPEKILQEQNLKYVAITRAESELIYLDIK